MKRHIQYGITLIEVLVALAIVALTLTSANYAFSQWLNVTQRDYQTTLARVCANNTLASYKLNAVFPNVGTYETSCPQLDQEFTVRTTVGLTPNRWFKKLNIQVFSPAITEPLINAVTVIDLATP